jgi:hypothetical protein
MKTFTIVRQRKLRKERGVVILRNGFYYGFIDPQVEVQKATGVLLDRHACIVSMAEGLRRAGNRVFMQYSQYPRYGAEPFVGAPSVPEYFLVGLAFARGEWQRISDSLHRHVLPGSRHTVFEATAKYYWYHDTAFSPLTLRVP